jgi:hypothetical protein
MKNPKELTPRGIKCAATVEITRLIRERGNEFHTVDDEGNPLTRLEALALLIWKKALGWTEIDGKTGTETVHSPERGFITMIYDRLDGRVAPAVADSGKKKATLSDRVGEQSKRRLNQMAQVKQDD